MTKRFVPSGVGTLVARLALTCEVEALSASLENCSFSLKHKSKTFDSLQSMAVDVMLSCKI